MTGEPWPTFPSWMQGLQAELQDLERTDLDVGKAAKQADEQVDGYLWRLHAGVPITRFRKGCGGTQAAG